MPATRPMFMAITSLAVAIHGVAPRRYYDGTASATERAAENGLPTSLQSEDSHEAPVDYHHPCRRACCRRCVVAEPAELFGRLDAQPGKEHHRHQRDRGG